MVRNLGCYGAAQTSDWYCQPKPVLVDSAVSNSVIAAALNHTCASDTTGRSRCWGEDASGQLGAGTMIPPTATPQPVAGGLTAAAIAAGRAHTCATGTDARIRCWGDGDAGQLGTGTASDVAASPVLVNASVTFRLP
jgi:alpha-tubulin suppressor-like RCC1 family protein